MQFLYIQNYPGETSVWNLCSLNSDFQILMGCYQVVLQNSKIGKGKNEILLFALELQHIRQSGIEKYYTKIFDNTK